MTVLITRPQPEAADLAEKLMQFGYPSVVDPMLHIYFFPLSPMDFETTQAIIFTSVNGVRGAASASINKSIPTYVVGTATAQIARDVGFVNVHATSGGALELCQELQKTTDPHKGSVVHFSGRHTAINLIQVLNETGFTAKRHIVYEAKPANNFKQETIKAINNKKIHHVLFFSPRTAQIFVRLLKEESLTKTCETMTAICFSQNIADALQGTFWKNLLAADSPNMEHLLPLLKQKPMKQKNV